MHCQCISGTFPLQRVRGSSRPGTTFSPTWYKYSGSGSIAAKSSCSAVCCCILRTRRALTSVSLYFVVMFCVYATIFLAVANNRVRVRESMPDTLEFLCDIYALRNARTSNTLEARRIHASCYYTRPNLYPCLTLAICVSPAPLGTPRRFDSSLLNAHGWPLLFNI